MTRLDKAQLKQKRSAGQEDKEQQLHEATRHSAEQQLHEATRHSAEQQLHEATRHSAEQQLHEATRHAAESHDRQAWLEALAERSRQSQQAFMNHIADRLGRPRMTAQPQHPYRGAPAFWRARQLSAEEATAEFITNFQAVGGHVERFASLAEAARFIADKAEELRARELLCQQTERLDALQLPQLLAPHITLTRWNSSPDENWRLKAAQADIGIVEADAAVATTGSLVLKSSALKGRAVSLLPAVLFALVPLEQMKATLGDVLVPLDEAGREALPAGVHFVSGPSRSADIENDLTIGVHGPGVVYALLVG